MTIKKNDFVEVEFVGKIKDTNEIFDTNIKALGEKANLRIRDFKPFAFSVGQKMLPLGFDNDIEGKEIGKEYSVEVKPEEGFGKRNAKLIQMIPVKVFHAQKINPVPGMQLTLDGQLAKVLSNNSGRVLMDFNNPLAGKTLIYNYKILRNVEDAKEKVDAMQDFFFRKKFESEIKGKEVTLKVPEPLAKFAEMISEKISEIIGMKVLVEAVKQEAKKE